MRTVVEITDSTGFNKVVFYQKGENEVPTALKGIDIQENIYVKVFGSIRVFKDERGIVGSNIKQIEKFDDLTNHLL